MKIFTAQQTRQWDVATMARQQITGDALMERAAGRCFDRIAAWGIPGRLVVLAGTGNNGGDGLCIARKAAEAGWRVAVFIAGDTAAGSHGFSVNLDRLGACAISAEMLDAGNFRFALQAEDWLVDALWGTGISRPAGGWMAELIGHVNASCCRKIAIDVPSGLLPDLMEPQPGTAVEADDTVTFGTVKPAFVFRENHRFTGRIHVLDIGLDPGYYTATESEMTWFDGVEAAAALRPFAFDSDKRSRGMVQLIAGSFGKIGAAVLAADAALRAGCGIVSASVPACGVAIVQAAVPEAMCDRAEGDNALTAVRLHPAAQCVAIGPGLGTSDATASVVLRVLEECRVPLVADADALNLVGANGWIDRLPAGTVLTPHEREFDRLFGPHANSFERLRTLRSQSTALGDVLLLKGPHTMVAVPDGSISFNASGHAGLSTAGAGDVLTGIIASLRAQGHEAAAAARLGAYVHGRAADILLAERNYPALLAGEIARRVPFVLGELAAGAYQ